MGCSNSASVENTKETLQNENIKINSNTTNKKIEQNVQSNVDKINKNQNEIESKIQNSSNLNNA